MQDEFAVAHRKVIYDGFFCESVGAKGLELLGAIIFLVQIHVKLSFVAFVVHMRNRLFFRPHNVKVIEHAVRKKECGHVFVDVKGRGRYGSGFHVYFNKRSDQLWT